MTNKTAEYEIAGYFQSGMDLSHHSFHSVSQNSESPSIKWHLIPHVMWYEITAEIPSNKYIQHFVYFL